MSFKTSRIGFLFFVFVFQLFANSAFAASLEVLQFREVRHEGAPALQLRFSEQVELSQLADNAVLSVFKGQSRLGESVDGNWLIRESGKVFVLPFVEPSRRYEIYVSDDLVAKSGSRLGDGKTLEVKTKSLTPAASFASSGFILSSANDKGLPISSVNVDAVDIDFFRIDPEQYERFLLSNIRRGDNSLYQIRDINQYGSLVHTSRFDLEGRKNQRVYSNLSIRDITVLEQAGLYVAVMRKAGVYEYDKNVIYFTVSDIGLHVRRFEQQMYVHAVHLNENQGFANIEVAVFDKGGLKVATDVTDEEGVTEILGSFPNAQYLTARYQEQLTVLKLANSNLDISDFKNALSLHQDIQVFAYGPRDIFRPGEDVVVQALLRDQDGAAATMLPLGVKLFRPDNKLVIETQLQPLEGGYYEFRYATGVGSQTGDWRVKFVVGGQELSQQYVFKLEEFRPNRLELSLFETRNEQKRLETYSHELNVPVSGAYLFGAPAAGNKVDAIVKAKLDRQPFTSLPEYFFGDDQEKVRYSTRTIPAIYLNQDGSGQLSVRNYWSSVKSPLQLAVTASLYEAGGKPVVMKDAVTILNNDRLIGIKPHFSGDPDKNVVVSFDLLAVNAEAIGVGAQQLQVELIREDRNYYWAYAENRGWYYEYDASPYESWSTEVTTDVSGAAKIEVPLEYGHYQLRVTDVSGKIVSRFSFKTAGRWWQDTTASKDKPQHVMLAFDKSQYEKGETVEIEMVSPHSGLAMVTVEDNTGVKWRKQWQAQQGKNTLEFVIPEDWERHDYHVTALVVNDNLNQSVTPSRAFGLKHLPLRRANAKLDVEIKTLAKSRPQQTINAEIQVNNIESQAQTFVTVALVDVGILNITKFRTPDPEAYLLAPRRYDVDIFDIYDKLIVANQGRSLAQSFGGDLVNSDEELSRGGKRPDADVQLVSFLSEPIAVDIEGKAKVEFEIPDFDGRLKWMVVAFNGHQYGKADTFSQIASPITAQVSHSPFYAFGDESQLTLELHNLLETEQEVEFSINSTSGFDDFSQQSVVELPAKTKHTVQLPIRVGFESDFAQFSLKVKNNDADEPVDLSRLITVPVRSPYPAETKRFDFELQEGERYEFDLDLAQLIPSQTQAQLILSSQPPIDYSTHLQYLLQYPYGCLEQTTSTAYPWLHVTQNSVERFGLNNRIEKKFGRAYDQSLKAEMLRMGIAKLKDKQRSDGSFSLWTSGGESASWLTVYATDFLLLAAQQGAQVESDMLNAAIRNLKMYVKRGSSVKGASWSRNPKHYEFAVRAYAAFVLARHKQIGLADVRRLKKDSEKGRLLSTLPWIQMALAFEQLGAKNDAKRLLDKHQNFRRERGYLGDYGSKIRDLAWILALKQEFDFDSNIQLSELFYELRGRRWLSTQERSQVMKLASNSNVRSDQLLAEVNFTQHQQTIDHKGQFGALMGYEQLAELSSIGSEGESLYGALTIVGAPNSMPLAKQDDFSIIKTYYSLDGLEKSLSQVGAGELLIVEIKVTSNEGTPDAMVVDLLPAGFAIENQNLKDASVDLSTLEINGEPIVNSTYLQHEEFREDRYVAAIKLWKYNEEKLYYLVRATVPGKYSVPPVFVEDMFKPSLFGLGITKSLNVIQP